MLVPLLVLATALAQDTTTGFCFPWIFPELVPLVPASALAQDTLTGFFLCAN